MEKENAEVQSSKYLTSFSKGFLMSVIAGACFCTASSAVKFLENIPTCHLAVYSSWATMSVSLPWSVASGENIFGPRDHRKIIFIRSILAAATVVLHYTAFRYLPLSEAMVLSSTGPVFVTVAARIFLKESFALIYAVSLITTVTGIILITGLHETFIQGIRIYSTEDLYGILAALGSVCTSTANILIVRKIRNVHPSVLTFNGGIVSFVIFLVLTLCTGQYGHHYRGLQQFLIILVGILSVGSQVSVFLALKFMQAGPATTIRFSFGIFLSFLLQYLIFGGAPDTIKVIGALLISSAIFFVGLSKHINGFFSGKCPLL